MMLVVGAAASGKRSYVGSLGYSAAQMSSDPASDHPVLYDAQELARVLEAADCAVLADSLANREVVICTEVGCGIVPIDASERAFRERAGRLAVALADRASCVVRVVCGIPQLIKGSLPEPACAASGDIAPAGVLQDRPTRLDDAACGVVDGEPRPYPRFLSVYRHAPTRLNRAHKYQGMVDEPLDWDGEEVAYSFKPSQAVRFAYVSPLSRSRQTARILFPHAQQIVVGDLAEMDFGDFDGYSYKDLSDDVRYRDWVESGCTTQCPNGEDRAGFAERVARGVRTVLADASAKGLEEAVIVAHGGTAMAAFWTFAQSEGDYFDWHIGVCEGLRARVAIFNDNELVLEEPQAVLPHQSL